jgi:transcriptional regulator with XRE-family HTH domain
MSAAARRVTTQTCGAASSRLVTALRGLLQRRGLTHKEFSRRISTSQPFVSLVLTGRSRIPRAALVTWADALDLQGDDRLAFTLAWVRHGLPPEAQDDIDAIATRAGLPPIEAIP